MRNRIPVHRMQWYLTARYTPDRLKEQPSAFFIQKDDNDPGSAAILIDATKTFQTIEGFGGAFTDAAAETFYKLSDKLQTQIISDYFNPERGIGYTLGRTHINSCDFSSRSYSYDEKEGDMRLEYFSIDMDKVFRIPFIRKALSHTKENFKLFASPWSPPAWMKTNNNMLHGGKLKKEYRQTWAEYYVKFVQMYQQEGITLWGLTVQNEPAAVQTWESCIYTAEEERNFVRDYLGPALKNANLNRIKLIIWDHNRDLLFHRAKIIYDDPETAKYIWGTGFHWYDGDHFENVRLVYDAFPQKKLLFTEGCLLPFHRKKITEWHCGETYAKSIIMDLNNGAAGWCDWNLLLDETGGPNHVSNFCFAPIIADTVFDELHYMNSFYYIGHFSKFIRPGAKRIICSSTCDELLCTAFLNPGGKIAVVIFNASEKEINFNFIRDSQTAEFKSPARSIMTIIL